jgi:hypothetical protein
MACSGTALLAFFYISDWERIPQATFVALVTIVIFIAVITTATTVTLVIIVAWGIPKHPDNFGFLCQCQRLNSDERASIITLCVYFLIYSFFLSILGLGFNRMDTETVGSNTA